VPEKGFHDLIDSFNQLLTYNSESQYLNNQSPAQDWKLVIVGDSAHEDKYSLRLKKKAYRTKNIIMTGFLTGEPLHELYSHAGLFVLPSYYEGLPIVLLEAMSYGLSCIASDIPANRDVELLAGDRFFKAGDINGLAKKINEFAVKPLSEEEKETQLNGINEKYNWDKIAQKTLKVYESIL
jgi:glycosyltransferase involved in cell wall biosynthesis